MPTRQWKHGVVGKLTQMERILIALNFQTRTLTTTPNLLTKYTVLRYISDGIAATSSTNQAIDLTKSLVPKLAEEAIYKHMLYGILLARSGTPGGLLGSLKKERFAETRKAKLRLSNLKLEELTQILRGSSKQIKH